MIVIPRGAPPPVSTTCGEGFTRDAEQRTEEREPATAGPRMAAAVKVDTAAEAHEVEEATVLATVLGSGREVRWV